MKTLLTLFLFFISLQSMGQTWCDAGANWKYTYTGFGPQGYTEIKYVGDTVIAGQQAQKLNKHIYAYDYLFSQYVDFDWGNEFTYENNGVVYLHYDNQWDTLYNFNANVGDSWRMAKQPMADACDSNSTLNVVATGSKMINSLSLNYLVVEFNYGGSMWSGLRDTIVEKIGFMGGYMLPYDDCNAALDVNEGGEFRCYEDNNFATFQPHYTGLCDFIVGMDDLTADAPYQLVPNPAHTFIELIGLQENDVVEIHDLHGKEMFVQRDNSQLWIEAFPSGMYILTIQNKDRSYHLRLVKE